MTALLGQILLTFTGLSIVAIGGALAVLPEMHRQVVDVHGWMDAATFARLFALAQVAPGPNILVTGVLGWQVASWPGMAAALVGMLAPAAALAWAASGALHRLRDAAWLRPTRAGLVPVAVGLLSAGGVTAVAAAHHGGPVAPLLALAAAAFVIRSDRSPLWPLLMGGLIGGLLG
jgi:chromate transporter